MNGAEQLLPLILIIAAFWFLLIRPQRKRQTELLRTQRAVASGDQVVLGSGIHGTVRGTEEDTIQLEVAPGTILKVARGAVMRIVDASPEGRDPEWTDQAGDAAGDAGGSD